MILASLSLASGVARGDDITPTAAVELGQYTEQLSVDLGTVESSDERALWNTRIALGVGYKLETLGRDVSVRGHSSAGFGLVYAPGDWPFHLRQEVAVVYDVTTWFALSAGLGTGFQVNASTIDRSYWEIGAALGARLGFFELTYYPMATVGLGSTSRDVYGGTMRQEIATGVAPFTVMARFHIAPLAW